MIKKSVLKGAILATVFTLSMLFIPTYAATKAFADKGSATFQWVAGTEPVCTMAGPDSCPDVAAASNGHTIAIAGSGTLSIHPKSVSGSGTFVEKDSNGAVVSSGTWMTTQLLSFDSYGTSPPFPSSAFGGQALIHVHLSTGSDGVLKVTCLIGMPPMGKEEGVELNIQGGPNFNHPVSGDTVFILS